MSGLANALTSQPGRQIVPLGFKGVSRASETIILRPADARDFASIARVHISAFPSALFSALGPEIVESFYTFLFHAEDRSVAQVVACDSCGIVGFCWVTKKPASLEWFITKRYGALALALIKHPIAISRRVLRRPIHAMQHALRWASKTIPHAEDSGLCRLLVIAVVPGGRRSGIGNNLLAAAEATSRLHGFRSMALTVAADNDAAIALYRSNGWTPSHNTAGRQEMQKRLL